MRHLTRSVLLATLAVGWGSGAGPIDGPAVIGSGRVKDEKRPVAAFRRVEVGSVIEATVSIGPETSLTLKAEDNLLPMISTAVRDGTLVVELAGKPPTEVDGREMITRNHPLRVAIVVPELDRLTVRDAATVQVIGTGMAAVTLKVRDAGKCKVRDLKAVAFDVEATDAGFVEIAGEGGRLSLVASKAAQVHASDATFRTAQVRLGPGGIVNLRVWESISGSVRRGLLEVQGEPRSRMVKELEGGSVNYRKEPQPGK